MSKTQEALKLALEGAANYIDALGGDSRKYRQALAEQPAQQEPVTIGGPVGWHSKQYGFVYMALQPHQFEVGSTLCLKNGTPAWRIESSCSMTALISMSSLPHGTVFYTSPPAQEFVCSTGLCHYRRPLTDEEIYKAIHDWTGHIDPEDEPSALDIARAIEAKLREKNA